MPGWVTILGQVNHLGTEPGTQVESAWAIPLWVGKNEYWLWLWPPLGKNGESCVTVGPVTRTAGILAYSRLKVQSRLFGWRKLYASLIGVKTRQLKASQKGWAPLQRTLALFAESYSLVEVRRSKRCSKVVFVKRTGKKLTHQHSASVKRLINGKIAYYNTWQTVCQFW